jgi:hypothetical protein
MMKLIKKILLIVLIIGIVLGCGSCLRSCYDYSTYSNTVEYRLQEIEDGVYGYYNAVTSNVPAENYEMIVLCFGSSIHTLKGDVNIHYTDEECKLIWKDVNIVNGDTFDIYVPYGSIDMRPNLVQS